MPFGVLVYGLVVFLFVCLYISFGCFVIVLFNWFGVYIFFESNVKKFLSDCTSYVFKKDESEQTEGYY